MTEVFISFSVSPLTLPLLRETRLLGETHQQVALARCKEEAGVVVVGWGGCNTHTSTMMTMSFGDDAPCMYLHKDPGKTALICFINPETSRSDPGVIIWWRRS